MKGKKKGHFPYKRSREARLVLVGELLSRGFSFRKIAEEVSRRLRIPKYGKTTASRDAETIRREWKKQRIESTEIAVALMLERNREHYQETREEWDKSRESIPRISKILKRIPSGSGDLLPVEAVEKKKDPQRMGDPVLMEKLIRLEDQRAKLLGLYRDKIRSGSAYKMNEINLSAEEKEFLSNLV